MPLLDVFSRDVVLYTVEIERDREMAGLLDASGFGQ
jgi:hypothetical protein